MGSNLQSKIGAPVSDLMKDSKLILTSISRGLKVIIKWKKASTHKKFFLQIWILNDKLGRFLNIFPH